MVDLFFRSSVTVTLTVALRPFDVTAAIVHEPFPTAVITPSSTVATSLLPVFQVIVVSSASSGSIDAVTVPVVPLSRVSAVLSRVTAVTAMGLVFTNFAPF